jgi:hypothetical protein
MKILSPRPPLEYQLELVWHTAKEYAERTGKSFWDDLSLTEQRKELENFKEDQEIQEEWDT